jgi:hypothetical protein
MSRPLSRNETLPLQGSKETGMDQNAQRKATLRLTEAPASDPKHERPSLKTSANGVAGDVRGMTLDQLDEAFQSGSIDATTLVSLQCIEGGAAGPYPDTNPIAEGCPEPDEPTDDPSPRTLAPAARAGDTGAGVRDRARARRRKLVQASALGLTLCAAAASILAIVARAPGSRRAADTAIVAAEVPRPPAVDRADPRGTGSAEARIDGEARPDPPTPERPTLQGTAAIPAAPDAMKPPSDTPSTRNPAARARQHARAEKPAKRASKPAPSKRKSKPGKGAAP